MKRSYYWLIGILLFLIITNPSIKAFKDYLGNEDYKHLQKKSNFFVCSIFECEGIRYFAILGNFFEVAEVIRPTGDNILIPPPDTLAVPVYPKDTVRMKK